MFELQIFTTQLHMRFVSMFMTMVLSLSAARLIQAMCQEEIRSSNRIVKCHTQRSIPSINKVESVHMLVIDESSLRTLHAKSFPGYSSLLFLLFKNCGIEKIDPEAFYGLQDLNTLNLEQNRLTSVPYNVFHDLRKLQHLYLSYNPIEELSDYAFPGLPLLETLSLEHCELKKIAPRAFIGLDRLKTLDLSYNRLKTLDGSMLRVLQTIHSLHVLYIYGNQWVCDCKLRWLRKWLDSKDGTDSLILQKGMDMLMCSGPRKVEGRDLMSVEVNQFSCKPSIIPHKYNYVVATRSAVNLTCQVHADPADNLRWYKRGFLLYEESVKESKLTIDDMIHGKMTAKNITMVHAISHVTVNDTGDYRCEVRNFAGEAHATVHLQLLDPMASSSSSLLWMSTGTFIAAVVGGGAVVLLILTITISCAVTKKRGTLKKAASQAASLASDKIYAAKSDIISDDPFGFDSYPDPPPIQTWMKSPKQTATVDPNRARNPSHYNREGPYYSSPASTPNRSTFRPKDQFYACPTDRQATYESKTLRNSDPFYHIYEAAPGEDTFSYV